MILAVALSLSELAEADTGKAFSVSRNDLRNEFYGKQVLAKRMAVTLSCFLCCSLVAQLEIVFLV